MSARLFFSLRLFLLTKISVNKIRQGFERSDHILERKSSVLNWTEKAIFRVSFFLLNFKRNSFGRFGLGSYWVLTLNYQQIFVVDDEIQSKLLMSWYQNFLKLVDCLIDFFPFSLDVVLLSRNGLRIMAMKGMEEDLAVGIFEFLLKID